MWFFVAALLLAVGCSSDDGDEEGSVGGSVEFGPCTEFIGASVVSEEAARTAVPDAFELDVADDGGVVAQVRAINCSSVDIELDDGTSASDGQHVMYQLGVAVLPPADLEPHPLLVDAEEITEFHAYAFATVTDSEPLADALEAVGIGGVHRVDGISFEMGDDDPDGCDLVPVSGSVSSPDDLALSFEGQVRDLGLEPEDGCEFGDGDITVSERALWYTEGPHGVALSDTAVPRSQILLFNADPETFAPYPVGYTPSGSTMQTLSNERGAFDFTLSGLLERGEVSTTLRLVTELDAE